MSNHIFRNRFHAVHVNMCCQLHARATRND
jgi:hypothetical protein